MPLYDYKCPSCGIVEELVVALCDLDTPVACGTCGNLMKRLMSTPHIQMDYAGYTCPITGKWVEGRAAHRANLQQHGCRILEAGEREDIVRLRKAEEKELDSKIEETVGRTITSWPAEKQSRLAEELGRGASANVIRQTPSKG